MIVPNVVLLLFSCSKTSQRRGKQHRSTDGNIWRMQQPLRKHS